MAHLKRKDIQAHVMMLLNNAPGGLRWGEIIKVVHLAHPETPINSISGATLQLVSTKDEISKVARGTYQLSKYLDEQSSAAVAQEEAIETAPIQVEVPGQAKITLLESDFYESFAQWLTDNAEEANTAVALGGSILKGKWGTPDVLGVLKPRVQDILKFETQIVSAEIKIEPSQPVVAFGQAIAYRLFSHKSYIVVPNTTSEDDLGRLKALCGIHGVGLVIFSLDKDNPDYTAVVLPIQANPDMFYANQMVRRLLDAAPEVFERLFS